MIKRTNKGHWPPIKAIYIDGIDTGNATFEQASGIGGYEDWIKNKIEGSSIVYIENEKVKGWAGLSHVSDRRVYAGVAEVSVYVGKGAQGKGIGSSLMQGLIDFAEENNIWTLQAGIFPENVSSVNLHLKYGFREVGIRKKLGKLNGQWRDVLLLERRSETIF